MRATLKQKTKIEYLVLPLYTYLLQDICRNDFEIINHKYFVIAYGLFESWTEKRKKKKKKEQRFHSFSLCHVNALILIFILEFAFKRVKHEERKKIN